VLVRRVPVPVTSLTRIASRKHGLIFIMTKKTAGTSIELALGPYCGPEDILTPISARHDLQRFGDTGVLAQQFTTPELDRRYRRALNKGNPKLLKGLLREVEASGFGAHARPGAIREKVGPFWETAFRFTSERHPYEKALSLAAMTGKDLESVVFNDTRYVGHPWYLEDGKLIVDRVILHDHLAHDFAQVLTHLGLPNINLPHARQTDRDRRPAGEQLTANQRAFVYEQCAPEFELFGWER